ncbi:hypothetical protein ILYODFUR_000100 [Ilyodon furcidens]|uniref:Uncharacterized protein n=1 Tax=Ilyodon furcidens TaxID=33524 RepID=A0ABV0VBF6_9TELE
MFSLQRDELHKISSDVPAAAGEANFLSDTQNKDNSHLTAELRQVESNNQLRIHVVSHSVSKKHVNCMKYTMATNLHVFSIKLAIILMVFMSLGLFSKKL